MCPSDFFLTNALGAYTTDNLSASITQTISVKTVLDSAKVTGESLQATRLWLSGKPLR